MSIDAFKYRNFDRDPTPTGTISISKNGEPYAVKFDTASNFSTSFFEFSNTYYAAAEIIANRMLEKRYIDELDNYFFPLFFLYRHSIELILKSIGCLFITEKLDRIRFINDTFHNLSIMLQYILDRTTVVRPPDEIIWLQGYFQSLTDFDRESDSFRYPFHIKTNRDALGEYHYSFHRVFQKQTHIDLIGEINKMEAAHEVLTNWYLDFVDQENPHISTEYTACGTTFLDEGGYYYEQSVVGYEYRHNDFYAHLSGYKECANYLKQYMIQAYDEGNNTVGYMFYPMCYLYRNDIELLLKATIFKFSGQPLQEICKLLQKAKHSIPKLFSSIEENILGMYDIDEKDPYIQNAKRYCELLHAFDHDSSKFRYPVDKRCSPHHASVRYYSFLDLGVFLESLCNAVEGIHDEIESRKDALDSLAADYSGYI